MFFLDIQYSWNMNSSFETDQVNRCYWPLPLLENHSSLATWKPSRLRRNWSAFKSVGTLELWGCIYFQKWIFSSQRMWTKELMTDMPAFADMQKETYVLLTWGSFHCHENRSSQLFHGTKRARKRAGMWGENEREEKERYYVNCHVCLRDEWKS